MRYSINNLLVAIQGMAALLTLMLTLHDFNKLKESANNEDKNLLSHYGMDVYNENSLKVYFILITMISRFKLS